MQLAELPDFSEIEVQTENTLYEITIIDGSGREILIRGGSSSRKTRPRDSAEALFAAAF